MRFFPPERNFSSLSIRDLLEARDAYHLHLAHLENVIGTAIGLFRIRKDDPDAQDPDAKGAYGSSDRPRWLHDSVVRRWSSPCVLVFVEKWQTLDDLKTRPHQAVPPYLYLPDGRVVPTCVVETPRDRGPAPEIDRLAFSSELLGGGYPVLVRDQGAERIGTLGCLVTDGEATYAITNRHVLGPVGRPLYTLIHGRDREIGRSHEKQLGKLAFSDVWGKWAGASAFINIDAGLLRIDDVNDWTSQVFGIGEIGELADVRPDTVTLDLIGVPLRAFGGASGTLEGEIQALFYRYRSVGGIEFVADLFVGARPGGSTLGTRPGDSGTIWFYDPPSGNADRRAALAARAEEEARELERTYGSQDVQQAIVTTLPAPEVVRPRGDREAGLDETGARARRLRPIAMQWGGQSFAGTGGAPPMRVALATFLSTVCRALDVELVREFGTGLPEYWGKHGHFKIGAEACRLVRTPKLRALMNRNRLRIGYDDSDLELGSGFRVGRDQFVPLADVADYIWISASHGGSNAGGRTHEGMQHFADMDEPGKGAFAGTTLLELSADAGKVSADRWRDFYAAFAEDERPEEGALPFRVWQLYDEMVASLIAQDVPRFVCVAGTLAHYVGDACQPLHASRLHHGRGPEGGKNSPEWAEYKKSPEYDIHAIYEQRMFEVRAVAMVQLINDALAADSALPARVVGGHAAAVATVELMRRCYAALPPETIIDADDPTQKPAERARILFDALGPQTADLVADGCRVLAGLWDSAFAEAHGTAIPWDALGVVPEKDLDDMVRKRDFLPALTFEEYAAQGYVAPQ